MPTSLSDLSAGDIRDAQLVLAKGRSALLKKAPYAAPTLLGLVPHFSEPDEVPTLAVSPGLVLYVNPIWLLSEPEFKSRDVKGRRIDGMEVVGACLYHEVHHVQRDLKRIEALDNGEADPDLANISSDIPINDMLIEAGWLLPSWVAVAEKYKLPKGKTLEWYYHELKRRPKQQLGPMKFMSGSCGGCARPGKKTQVEEQIDKVLGRTPIDVDRIRYETNEKARAQRARGHGALPGVDIEDVPFIRQEPMVPWPQVLRHVMTRATGIISMGQDDYSYKYPSKKSMVLGVIRPGFASQQIDILFVTDTSGSMGEEQLNSVKNQVVFCLQALGYEEARYVDADVAMKGEPKTVRLKDIPALKMKGRGGTNFIPVFEQIKKLKKKPDVVIYQTDGDGPAPDQKPPGIEVVWCIMESPYMKKPANWGRIVVCSNDPHIRARFAA